MARPFLALVAAGAAAVTLAGCGGGTDATAGLTAQQILDKAAARTDTLTSYRFGVDLKVDAQVAPGALDGQAGQLLGQPIDITGEGGAREPGDFTVDVTASPGDVSLQANITKVGGNLYASVLGQAIKLDLPADAVASVDVTRLAPSIASWVKDPQVVGTEEVDGVALVHVRGAVDTAALATDADRVATGLGSPDAVKPGTGAQAEDVLRTGTVDVWVGEQDMYIHRAAAKVVTDGALASAPDVKALDLDLSASLSDFNGDVQVTAPAGARTVDLDSILGLLGG